MSDQIIQDVDGMRSSTDLKEGFIRGVEKRLIPVKYNDIDGFARCEGCIVLGSTAEIQQSYPWRAGAAAPLLVMKRVT